jgi:pimeloyl-ACP methyl ester carboxylesterase
MLGEGYGALLAVSVAARNPGLDLVLVLVDPGVFL